VGDATTALLRITGLTVFYGNALALSDFSLSMAAREFVVLVGRNGAGKTTTLSTIVGLLRARRGEIWFEDRQLDGLETHEVYQRGVVLVPQGRGIFKDLSVRDNLLIGAFPRLLSRARRQVSEDYANIMSRFPLLKQRERISGGQLSGGEQQVLAIARALMARPSLLLLDEPFMGLDPLKRKLVSEVIAELHSRGTAVIMAEQNIDTVMRLADQVILINGGRVVDHLRGDQIVEDRSSLLLTRRKDS
jgi:branched-chain amino acid transport system ATP-binding protein